MVMSNSGRLNEPERRASSSKAAGLAGREPVREVCQLRRPASLGLRVVEWRHSAEREGWTAEWFGRVETSWRAKGKRVEMPSEDCDGCLGLLWPN